MAEAVFLCNAVVKTAVCNWLAPQASVGARPTVGRGVAEAMFLCNAVIKTAVCNWLSPRRRSDLG